MAELIVSGEWKNILRGKLRRDLESFLPDFLPQRRWFGGKARSIRAARIFQAVPFPCDPAAYLLLIRVEYAEGSAESYLFPLTYAAGEAAARVGRECPQAVFARLRSRGREGDGVLYDALWEKTFLKALFEVVVGRRRFRGPWHQVMVVPPIAGGTPPGVREACPESSVLDVEQSNTSVVYGGRYILKVFRRLGSGVNPDLEIGRFLTERGFPHIPPLAGALEYRPPGGEATTLAILQGFVPNRGDAWRYTLEELHRYFDGIPPHPVGSTPRRSLLDRIREGPPALARERIGSYLESSRLLGRRTAELHLALAGEAREADFAPESFSPGDRLSLSCAMVELLEEVLDHLRRRPEALPEKARGAAREVLSRSGELRRRFESLRDTPLTARRIRCHGDYHLGQVLYTGRDFVIIDFEGEPARPLAERRRKISPLRDVAGMLRSFHYASYAALWRRTGAQDEDRFAILEGWARFWNHWVSAAFLGAYLDEVRGVPILPAGREELRVLLDAFLLEKAVYELGYELNSRPDWVAIPLQGIQELLSEGTGG